MVQRFKIEDLVVQDSSGVVFRARDTETGQTVAIHRFFPFGASGGGLSGGRQDAFVADVNRLATLHHPALRAILSGGCDPNDGIPFIATEWIKGVPLQALLDHRSLIEQEAIPIITLALEVSEILSEIMAADGVWVDTGSHAVIIGKEGSGRPITFSISPTGLLGRGNAPSGVEPLIAFTTTLMGWTEKPIRSLSATGLGGWLKWLHDCSGKASIREAREMLAAAIGVEPPLPAKRTVRLATPQAARPKVKSKSKAPAWILACGVLLAIAAGGGLLIRRHAEMLAAAVNAGANAPLTTADIPSESPPAAATELEQTGLKSGDGAVFSPMDHESLMRLSKQAVVVEGVLETIGRSTTGNTLYLLFTKSAKKPDFRGAIRTKYATGELSEAKLNSLCGKRIRLSGTIRIENQDRPVIDIKNRNAIQLAQ